MTRQQMSQFLPPAEKTKDAARIAELRAASIASVRSQIAARPGWTITGEEDEGKAQQPSC